MPKFNVTASFSLETTIEPEGVQIDGDYTEGVEDFSDDSSFGSESVESYGGDLTFTVTAEDEDAAEDIVRQVIEDGNEVEDHNGFTWIVTGLDVSIEQVEEPMTLERAIDILVKLFDRLAENGQVTDEEKEALAYLLKHIATQTHTAHVESA